MIYLDNAATTRIDSGVLEAMMPYLTEKYGNPGAIYEFGRRGADAVQKAREQVSRFVGGEHGDVIFTSGGSEANSLVFHAVKDRLKEEGRTHILVSAVEHESVLRAANSLIKDGFCVERIPVGPDCRVSLTQLERMVRPDTGLVSVMYVNNETGAENPVGEIGGFCMKHGILFHTDCVQAVGCQEINAVEIGCDFLTVSSHKIHGPKGVGALWVKDRSRLSPLIWGGHSQEYGLRGGTENVAGIVGFGEACAIAQDHLQEDRTFVSTLRQRFVSELMEHIEKFGQKNSIHINGGSILAPGKTVNILVDGVDSQTLILLLSTWDVCISAGSACSAHDASPSHVLTAMGLSKEEAMSSIRVSFSRMNKPKEVSDAAMTVAYSISAIRNRREEN